jgi:O-antigen/teichoic acid export membrane protein
MALSMRVAGAGGMFVSHIVLARSLGVTGFADYALAITWLQVLTVLAKLGLDNASLRYVSEYVTKREVDKLSGFTQDSTRASLLAGMVIMVGVVATVLVFWRSIGDGLASGLIIAALMIPLVALRQIQEASLRGIGRLFESQIATVVWPWTLSLLAGIAWYASLSGLSSRAATALHLISICVVSILVYHFSRQSTLGEEPFTSGETSQRQWRSQRRQRRAIETQQSKRESCRRLWKHTAMAFLFAEILIVLKSRACVALAGILLDRESVGLYGAMEKFADVSVLASQSLGLIIAPQFAALHAAGRFPEMRRLMRQGQILGLSTTIPAALVVAFFGDYVFVLLGPGYREGWSVLMALLASACIASFSGPAAYVLQMTGHERTMLIITAASAATNILLSLVLMRACGLLGLGIAQMATSVVWMVGVRWSLVLHPAWQNGSLERSTTHHHVQAEVSA